MSFLWLFIYLIFAAFILAMFFWSTIILQRQKNAWKKFAEKHNLSLKKGTFFEASAVEGNYKKNKINLFSQPRSDEKSRGMVKYRTTIEVIFDYGFPGVGALGNISSMSIIEYLDFGPTFHPEDKSWNTSHLVTCSDRDFIKAYLTPKRLEKINSFLNIPNAMALLVYDAQDAFIRVETADPLTDIKKIETFIDKLIVLTKDLKITEEERKKWSESKVV